MNNALMQAMTGEADPTLNKSNKVLMYQPLHGPMPNQMLVFTELGQIFLMWLLPPDGSTAMVREITVEEWDDVKATNAIDFVMEARQRAEARETRASAEAAGIAVPPSIVVPDGGRYGRG